MRGRTVTSVIQSKSGDISMEKLSSLPVMWFSFSPFWFCRWIWTPSCPALGFVFVEGVRIRLCFSLPVLLDELIGVRLVRLCSLLYLFFWFEYGLVPSPSRFQVCRRLASHSDSLRRILNPNVSAHALFFSSLVERSSGRLHQSLLPAIPFGPHGNLWARLIWSTFSHVDLGFSSSVRSPASPFQLHGWFVTPSPSLPPPLDFCPSRSSSVFWFGEWRESTSASQHLDLLGNLWFAIPFLLLAVLLMSIFAFCL
jgi:hypothetical protein